MTGIKELTEAINAGETFITSTIRHTRDGFQATDVLGIIKDCIGPVVKGASGAGKIDDELKDLDSTEKRQVAEQVIGLYNNIRGAVGGDMTEWPELTVV